MNIPFKMSLNTDIERWRAETFWDKEPETIEWIKSFGDKETFFDIGANIGVYSLYAASINPTLKIYAFEPVIANYLALINNIQLNKFKNIIALPFAFSNKSKVAKIKIIDNKIGASGSQVSDNGEHDVMVFSIDTFCYFIRNKPDHIKIDVDGIEGKIIKGAKQALKKIKSLLIELDNIKNNTLEIEEQIISSGFITDNRFNRLENHSNKRRGGNPENVIFTR